PTLGPSLDQAHPAFTDGRDAGMPPFRGRGVRSILPARVHTLLSPRVARFEWAVSRALRAPDLPALEIRRLNTVVRGCFQLQPSVGFVQDRGFSNVRSNPQAACTLV